MENKISLAKKIGNRIKELRKQAGLTLKQLAEASGLTSGTLSKIENGLAMPSIPTLQVIADALKTDVGYFFKEEDEKGYFISRRGKRKVSYSERGSKGKITYEVESLTEGMENPFMEPVIVTLVSRKNEDLEVVRHGGQELLYIIEGKIEFTLGEKKLILKKGDSAYFNGDIPHKAISLSKKPAMALNVLLVPGRRPRIFGAGD